MLILSARHSTRTCLLELKRIPTLSPFSLFAFPSLPLAMHCTVLSMVQSIARSLIRLLWNNYCHHKDELFFNSIVVSVGRSAGQLPTYSPTSTVVNERDKRVSTSY